LTFVAKVAPEPRPGNVQAIVWAAFAGRVMSFNRDVPTKMTLAEARGAPTDAAPAVGARILIVDDDEELSRHIADYLADNNLVVETARDGPTMDRALARSPFDLVILDVMMPGEDGLSICKRLASSPASIIMMSAVGEAVDRIVGLELGADDYLAKPCSPRELLARVRAVLRRRDSARRGTRGGGLTYRFGGYELDAGRNLLKGPSGVTVLLSRGDYALLLAFLDNPKRILSREELADCANGDRTENFDRAIDVQISRLRRKMGDSEGQEIIRTVRGAGYKLATTVTRL
jgi:two-component system, OmpR family, response regulator